MAGPGKESKSESQGVAGRRSTRLAIAIPISISGKDTSGHTFKENSRTVIINRHGAKILTTHQLALGAELVVDNRALGITARTNVVWLGDRRTPKDPQEIGVQLTEASNIWGIEFPPEDWQEGPPIGPGGQRLTSAPAPPASTAPAAPKPAAPPPAPAPAGNATAGSKVAPPPPAASAPPAPKAAPPTPPPAAAAPSGNTAAALDTALAHFTEQIQARVEEQAKVFEARLAHLVSQMGTRSQVNFQDAANQAQDQAVARIDEHAESLSARLANLRSEIDPLAARVEDLKQALAEEVGKAERNVREASWQAIQGATEQLSERFDKQLESMIGDFVAAAQKRLQEEGAKTLEDLSSQTVTTLQVLSGEHWAQVEPELQARQEETIEQTKKLIAKAGEPVLAEIQDALEKKAAKAVEGFESQLEKSLKKAQEKAVKDAGDELRKTMEGLKGSLAKDLEKGVAQARQELKEALKSSWKELADDARKRLAALTQATVDSLNAEVTRGLEGFQKQLSERALGQAQAMSEKAVARAQETLVKNAAEVEAKTLGEMQARLQTSMEKILEDCAARLNKHTAESLELALAKLEEKMGSVAEEAEESFRSKLAGDLAEILQPRGKKSGKPESR